MNQPVQIIDGDGHIFEDGDGIARHFPFSATGGRLRSGVFPLNSHIQYSLTRRPPGAFATTPDGRFENPGPDGWIDFMNQVGISHAVLFPPPANGSGVLSIATTPLARRGHTTIGWLRRISSGIHASKASPLCRCMMRMRHWKSCIILTANWACAPSCFQRRECT